MRTVQILHCVQNDRRPFAVILSQAQDLYIGITNNIRPRLGDIDSSIAKMGFVEGKGKHLWVRGKPLSYR